MSHPNKPDVLLLSGLLCDESVWSEITAELGDMAIFHAVAFPGFTSIGDMAAHVLATAPPHFVLVGHSMGGRVALEILNRAPDRVLAIGLFNTGTNAMADHEPVSRGRLVTLAQTSGMHALAEQWLPPMMNANAPAPAPLTEALTRMVERATPESFAAQIKALLDRPNAVPVLSKVKVPTLLLSATGDRWSPVAQHEAMQQLIPDADLIVIDDAGHMAPAEQPAAVAAALRTWLGKLGRHDLDNVDRLAIEARCIRQINRYARLNDDGDFEGLAALLTEDAVYARPSDPDAHIRGRDAIRTSLLSRPKRTTRHIMSGIEIEVQSSTRATALSSVTLYLGADARITATLIGTFDDVLELTDGEWLFSQRLGAVQLTA